MLPLLLLLLLAQPHASEAGPSFQQHLTRHIDPAAAAGGTSPCSSPTATAPLNHAQS